jgi:hypothetical protein
VGLGDGVEGVEKPGESIVHALGQVAVAVIHFRPEQFDVGLELGPEIFDVGFSGWSSAG